MKKIFWEDGKWWYRHSCGTRQSAKIRPCETCGSEFATYPSGETRFCSKKCWRRPCKRCGSTFTPRTKRTEYCSTACIHGNGICEHCSKTFVFSKNSKKRFCSLECWYDGQYAVGSVTDDPSGYTITKVPAGTPGVKLQSRGRSNWMWTHRYVMQTVLGRPLLKTERVHHINGKRNDNRPENLELWKGSHPSGVRAADYHCAGCRCFEHSKLRRERSP